MTFDTRFVIVVLAAFATASAAASGVAAWQWRRLDPPVAPRDHVTFLFHLRLLPLAAGLLWAALAISSFLLFEPRASRERVGLVMVGLSLVALALLCAAAGRVIRAARRRQRTLGSWLMRSQPIALPGLAIPAVLVDTDFPVVAVDGILRPRLIVARSVRDACTPDELAAILDHERGHITRRDNARRMLLLALPDPLAWTRLGRAMDLAWHDAAEEVADEAPGDERGDAGRVALASALVRVAGLVPPGQMLTDLPASALYRGEPLERRVRRLLDPVRPRPRARRRYQWAVLAGLIGLGVVLLSPIHQLLEAAVTFLP